MKQLIAVLTASLLLAGCSEIEGVQKLAKAGEIMENAAESNFEPQCTEPLEQFEQSIEEDEQGNYAFTASQQQQAHNIFQQCLDAFNEELALAKTELGDLDDIPNCKKALSETEAQYPKLVSSVDEFAALPSSASKEDQQQLTMQFTFTSAQIYMIGAMPMVLRTTACPMEKAGLDMNDLTGEEQTDGKG